MNTTYNVYCDESCHLPNDNSPIMVIGAVWCPKEKAGEINVELRKLKTERGLSPKFELKWTKVSNGQIAYYLDVINYFRG